MVKYTPMMEQYLSIKAQVQDAFLFFRLGDFYEMFFEDAINGARELEITLTGREAGVDERVPMCGIPYHAVEAYISRLIEKGFKVAICEQVEDPAVAKGVVRREIVRIITPGTVMEGKILAENHNNFLATIVAVQERFALAACDITTGECYALVVQTWEEVMEELQHLPIAEIIGSGLMLERMNETAPERLRKISLTERVLPDNERLSISDSFPQLSIPRLPTEVQAAVSLLLAYLLETQKRSLQHLRSIQILERGFALVLDPFSRKNLELSETVRDRTRKGSLLWLLDETMTAMGARLLRRWLDKPLTQCVEIELRLDAVSVFVSDMMIREEIRQLLKEVYDLERLSGRIAFGTANARDLSALGSSLAMIPALTELCAQAADQSSMLQQLVDEQDVCADIRQWIEAAIHSDPPASIREGGIIKEGYHERLDQLRKANRAGKQWIVELEQAEREATGIRSLKVGYNKVFGYYIEITKANLNMVPAGRYERKQTLAAAERFITPELKEQEALILEAEEKMVDLEHQLFIELRERIASEIPRLQRLAERLATLDVLQSFAKVAANHRYVRPEVHAGYDLEIIAGRHPVVESVLTDTPFIPNDTLFYEHHRQALLITGPNMAGKSTYMRQVALIIIMAQMGSFVPAKSARIPMIDRLFTRIGAADDLVGGQSTFMVEMRDIQTMIAKATPRSLVVIDELGRGTSTGEGMAIAQAVIEHLHELIGCKMLISTHYHELAHLAESLPYLTNACMAVKESGQQVTFLRKLIDGAAGSSYGIYCAQLAGLPTSVIGRAYHLLREYETITLGLTRAEPAHFTPIPPSHEVIDLLKSKDLMNMTPMDAMLFLVDLQKKL
jgi:DNA mismatch repair protein MutS